MSLYYVSKTSDILFSIYGNKSYNVMFQSLMFRPLLPQLVLINIWVALFLSPSLGLGKSALGRQQPKAETGFDCVRCTPIVRASSIHHTTDPFSNLSKLQNVFVQVKIYNFPSENVFFTIEICIFFKFEKHVFDLDCMQLVQSVPPLFYPPIHGSF